MYITVGNLAILHKYSALLGFIGLVTWSVVFDANAQEKVPEDGPKRLLFFDIIVDDSLKQLKSQRGVLTKALASELTKLPGLVVIDQGSRDSLILQRKMVLTDCDKAECRFAMARALPGIDLMMEVSIDSLGKKCALSMQIKSVKNGAIITNKFDEMSCETSNILAAIQETTLKIWPPVSKEVVKNAGKNDSENVEHFDGMVNVPAGDYWRGCGPLDTKCKDDEKPGRKLYVGEFSIDKTEVTVGAYAACVSAGLCSAEHVKRYETGSEVTQSILCNYNSGRGHLPMNCVTWNEAKIFCESKGKRLPTEAQWEKAARGSDARNYPWGNEPANCDYAVMNGNGGNGCGKESPWAVGSKPNGASPFGALDMAGNVSEWVADAYDKSYYSSAPDRDPENKYYPGMRGVTRGGNFLISNGELFRASRRTSWLTSTRIFATGFRCAR